MLAELLAVELGLLVVVFGGRFKAGWRSHTQAISIGLAVGGFSWLALQEIWLTIAKNAHPTTRIEYDKIVALGTRLVNGNKIVYIAVLIWWIFWLWCDEPGTEKPESPETEPPVENAAV
jgi:ABC-type uncharacterized transport system permease subunit